LNRTASVAPHGGQAPARTTGLALGLVLLVLAGCASGPRGRDGPPSSPPGELSQLSDAEPRVEPIRASGGTSKPYTVLGRSYAPITDDRPFRESGLASWYGTKFHAQPTASGEPYDMYAMTAAHKTLPLPSYVRVRNPANGREAIVRVNDRGPFHDGRVIDLSYAAAYKLDLLRGVAPVEIERITNEDIRAGNWRRDGDATAIATTASADVPVSSVLVTPVVATLQPDATPLAALPAAAPADMPADTPMPGFWVQLGAFSQPGSASGLREQVNRGMPALGPQLKVFSERGLYRVQAGPYASRDVAREMAEQLRAGLQLSPLVLERR
jgi:rare lipoprotein A